MTPIHSITLNDGVSVPVLAYGTGTVHLMGQGQDIGDMTAMALQNGFHHLDCAEAYQNEAGVGAGIKAAGVARKKLFITDKVVGTKDQDIEAALAISLDKLGVSYLDLYLVHVPFSAGSPAGLQKIWAQMEAVKRSGKVRSIGVSNFDQSDLEIILETANMTPSINQIELHPYIYQQNIRLLDFHRHHNITTGAFSPLAAITVARPGPLDGLYANLARKHGVSEGDVALRWALDQDFIVVTTSKSAQRLQTYTSTLFDFKLDPREIEQITELGKQKHYQGVALKYMGAMYGNYKLNQAKPA